MSSQEHITATTGGETRGVRAGATKLLGASIVFGTTLEADCLPWAEVAGLLAMRMNARLHLVHVSEDPRAPIVLGTDEERILGPVRSRLSEEAERVRAVTGASVHVHLASGSVVEALVSVARFETATALVLGRATAPGRPLLGATAERVARHSSVPSLTLRAPERLLPWLRGERALRVLVGADPGRASHAARAFAHALCAVNSVQVEVVFVASPKEVHRRLGLPVPEDEHQLAPPAQAALLRDLGRAAPVNGSEEKLRVLAARGSADAHLASLADQENFDLVVVGQRRNSLIEQLWYGSVARGVLRSSPVSVACVPPMAVSPPGFREPQVVVVSTDFGEAGARAVAQAIGVVAAPGTVHVVHVISSLSSSELEAVQAREQAWYALGCIANLSEARSTVELVRHVLEGAPADELLSLAERTGADLIVLGSRGPSEAPRAVLGSVARAVSERARVPVLLIPPPEA